MAVEKRVIVRELKNHERGSLFRIFQRREAALAKLNAEEAAAEVALAPFRAHAQAVDADMDDAVGLLAGGETTGLKIDFVANVLYRDAQPDIAPDDEERKGVGVNG